MGQRAIALVSGGLDSVVSLAKALDILDVRLVLFLDYRQRALDRERQAVIGIASYYGLPIMEVDLGWLEGLSPPGMQSGDGAPTIAADPKLDRLDDVWVPNRNGVFLNVAAAYAEKYKCELIVTGFNREEASEFPDNSKDYVQAVNASLKYSTRNSVRVESFTQDLGKREIIELGLRLRAPLANIWSCYSAGEIMCGTCASCRRLKGGLEQVSVASRPRIDFAG